MDPKWTEANSHRIWLFRNDKQALALKGYSRVLDTPNEMEILYQQVSVERISFIEWETFFFSARIFHLLHFIVALQAIHSNVNVCARVRFVSHLKLNMEIRLCRGDNIA